MTSGSFHICENPEGDTHFFKIHAFPVTARESSRAAPLRDTLGILGVEVTNPVSRWVLVFYINIIF